MKYIKNLILLLLLVINLVESFEEIFTNFTINSSSCLKENKFEVDQCYSWCGSDYYGRIIYNLKSKKYEINIYYDKECSIIMPDASLPEISCPKGKVTNESGDEVVCSGITSIVEFKSFTIKQVPSSSKSQSSCKNNNLKINSCSNWCNANFKIVKGSGTVNSYNISIFENSDNCNDIPTLTKNIRCLTNNQEISINDHFKFICNENDLNSSSYFNGSHSSSDSLSFTKSNSSTNNNHINNNNSSSTISYSILLLSVITLFSILL